MDSQIKERFKIFCEAYLQDKNMVNDENLYMIFKYAYLKGRKEALDELSVEFPISQKLKEYHN